MVEPDVLGIMGGTGADLAIHTLTIVAVPMFMATSGYLIFFRTHHNDKFWVQMIRKYVPLFLFWFIAYVIFTYYLIPTNQDKSIFTYALENSDGWAYWYLVVLIEVLIVYPLIKLIVSHERAKYYYIVLWVIMVSIKQTMMISYIPSEFFDIIQLPLFQTRDYIGGTVFAHYPTECLGVFIVLGAFINGLIESKVSKTISKIVFAIGIFSGICIFIGAKIIYSMDKPVDVIMQPIQILVVVFSAAVILLVKKLYTCTNEKMQNGFQWLSERSLGIYVVHPFIIVFVSRMLSKLQVVPIVLTLLKGGLTVVISLAITCLIKVLIPKRISYYIV